jgi:hypothetical protein
MNTKKCPYCSEEILLEAKKCKYCSEFIDDDLKKERINEQKTGPPQEIIVKKKNSGLVTFLVVLAIIALIGLITGL